MGQKSIKKTIRIDDDMQERLNWVKGRSWGGLRAILGRPWGGLRGGSGAVLKVNLGHLEDISMDFGVKSSKEKHELNAYE